MARAAAQKQKTAQKARHAYYAKRQLLYAAKTGKGGEGAAVTVQQAEASRGGDTRSHCGEAEERTTKEGAVS